MACPSSVIPRSICSIKRSRDFACRASPEISSSFFLGSTAHDEISDFGPFALC